MPPANPTRFPSIDNVQAAERAIRDLIFAQSEWFVAENGLAPIAINNNELEFYVAHRRLIFSCWTEQGSRTWRVSSWNWSGEKLSLQTIRRMGAESATIELVPRVSAKALVASIAAARRMRVDKLAQLGAEHLSAKIESSTLSPGMRRDQPGRYARIILRLPHTRIAVTAVVARSDARNVDSLFSSTCFGSIGYCRVPKNLRSTAC